MVLWALASSRCPIAVDLFPTRREAEEARDLFEDERELLTVELVDLDEPAPLSLN
jgi:hypothetical protein